MSPSKTTYLPPFLFGVYHSALWVLLSKRDYFAWSVRAIRDEPRLRAQAMELARSARRIPK